MANDESWKAGKVMETKVLPLEMLAIDATGRTVEGYGAAFGNVDQQGDVIKSGAFQNSITQRGTKVKFLWQHDVNEPIGKIQELREDEKGLYFKAVISDTQRGRDCLALLRDKAIDSLSIGYDALPGGTDYIKDAGGQTIRTLSDIRLWEISMVTFPANEQAVVTGLKQATPSEAKPYDVIREGDQWCVYKIGPDGKPMGKPLGEHATEEEAQAQLRALYASEPDAGKDAEKDVMADYPWEQCMRDQMDRYGDEETARRVCGAIRANASADVSMETARAKVEADLGIKPRGKAADGPESVKVGRRVSAEQLRRAKEAHAALGDFIKWAEYGDEDESAPPQGAAPDDSQKSQAGPVIPPTDFETLARLVEIEEQETRLMEV